jgi:hypothetical protein
MEEISAAAVGGEYAGDVTVVIVLFADSRHRSAGCLVLACELPTTVGSGMAFAERRVTS